MANPDHVAKLKEGARAWNAWRAENPDVVPDLRDLQSELSRVQNSIHAIFHGVSDVNDLEVTIDVDFANLEGVDVRSNVSTTFLATNLEGDDDDITEDHLSIQRQINQTSLVNWKGLSQTQVNSMRGDMYSNLPDDLEMPEQWLNEPVEGINDPWDSSSQVSTSNSMLQNPTMQHDAVEVFMSQAKIVLANPVTSKFVATGVSEQLNAAIREFRENHQSNETPEVVLLLETISTSFAALGREIDAPNNETALASELADLRDQISKLTAEIDELKSKPTDKSDFAKAKTAAAEAFGKTIGTGIAASVLGGAGYFLGAHGPEAMEALSTAWSKLVGGSYPSAPTSPNIS